MFKIKAAVSFPKPSYNYSCLNLIPQSNILHIYGYNKTNPLLLTAVHDYLRYLFVTRYNCLCFISMFAWVVLKKATFCGNNCENNCENVGIILRIIGEFKKNFQKE